MAGVPKSPLVLCVDGGGTKTAAVIADRTGVLSHGLGGSCNVTNVGLFIAVTSVTTAINNAITALPASVTPPDFPSSNPPFAAVWIALAGLDRPSDFAAARPAFAKLLSMPEDSLAFRVGNDAELLASPLSTVDSSVQSAVTLIAGTGSIAMSFTKDEAGLPVQIGRSRGWGHIYGDEGSGYHIGMSTVRSTLLALDRHAWTSTTTIPLSSLSAFHQDVLAHFDVSGDPDEFLAAVHAAPGADPSEHDNVRKVRVASTSRVTFAHAFPPAGGAAADPEALRIVKHEAADLAETIVPLVDRVRVRPESAILTMGGALLGIQDYRKLVLDELAARGVVFADAVRVEDTSVSGALALAVECL